MKLIASLLILTLNSAAWAFPDMIKHGYTNCTACHMSPAGGGVLNQYGRNLSKDLISTWSGEKEAGVFHGLVNTEKVDEWLALGGDFRGVQVHQENETIKRGRWVNMQAGVEVAVFQPSWALVAFIGQYVKQNEWKEYSPRYYGLWNIRDELSLKVGKFLPNFGINLPDHIISTRGPLQFGYGMEKESAEMSWLGEEWNFIGGYAKSPKYLSANNQSAVYGVVSKVILENKKVGIQHYAESDDTQKRSITGVLGYLGWSKDLSTLFEIDQQETAPKVGVTKTGYSMTQRTSYELTKGVHAIVLNDYLQTDSKNGSTKNYKYGPGLQWFPRPHLDLQAFWTREQSGSFKEGDYAWLVLHYYL